MRVDDSPDPLQGPVDQTFGLKATPIIIEDIETEDDEIESQSSDTTDNLDALLNTCSQVLDESNSQRQPRADTEKVQERISMISLDNETGSTDTISLVRYPSSSIASPAPGAWPDNENGGLESTDRRPIRSPRYYV